MEAHYAGNERWQAMIEVQAELHQSLIALPRLVHADGSTRDASPRTVRFAEALAFSDAWSGITDARQRRTDLAA